MKVWVEYSEILNAHTIKHQGVYIRTDSDIDEWEKMVISELENAIPKNEKTWLLVDFDEFDIGPKMAEKYGRVAEKVRVFAKDVIRYNCGGLLTRTSVRSKAAKQGYKSHICKDRQEAEDLLRELQSKE